MGPPIGWSAPTSVILVWVILVIHSNKSWREMIPWGWGGGSCFLKDINDECENTMNIFRMERKIC